MARFFKNGSTLWNLAASWSATSAGGVDNAGVPTAADDVIFELLSGSCQINTNAVCRSLDTTSGTGSYGGAITYDTNARTLTIGDATVGAGNVALKFNSGMTYTTLAVGNTISFVSTSTTVQTVTWGGVTTGSVTFNGAGGKWQIQDTWVATGAIITLSTGTLNTNGAAVTADSFAATGGTRTVTLGTSNITITGSGTAWNLNTSTGLTTSMASSTITFTNVGAVTISTGGNSAAPYGSMVANAPSSFSTSSTFKTQNFTRTGPNSKTASLTASSSWVVQGTLTLGGQTTQGVNRLVFVSSVIGTSQTINCSGGAVVISGDVDFQDIDITGSPSWANTGSAFVGDCGGNGAFITSNITTPATQTATGTASFLWSTHGWTSRVPLPQDNVVVSNSFIAGRTVTFDMPRLGLTVNLSGATGSPAIALTANLTSSFFGSFMLATGMTTSSASGAGIRASGRSSFGITGNGVQSTLGFTVIAPGGTYTQNDAWAQVTNSLNISNGTWATGGFGLTIGLVGAAATLTLSAAAATFNGGTSTVTINTGTATTVVSVAAGATINCASTTFVIATASANTRTFAGGGNTFGTLTYTVAGSTGQLNMTGSNTFGTINFSDVTNARSLKFTSGTTNKITIPNIFGTAGKLMTVSSITAASAATIQSTQPGKIGANSTSVSGNTGITVAAGTYMDYLSVQDITWVQLSSGSLLTMGVG